MESLFLLPVLSRTPVEYCWTMSALQVPVLSILNLIFYDQPRWDNNGNRTSSATRPRTIHQALISLFRCLVNVVVLVAIALATPKLTHSGPFLYPGAYATAYAIIAAAVTAFSGSWQRELLLYRVDDGLMSAIGLISFQNLNSSWRTILDLEDIKEIFKSEKINVCYLLPASLHRQSWEALHPLCPLKLLVFRHIFQMEIRICSLVCSILEAMTFTSQNTILQMVMTSVCAGAPTRMRLNLMGNINTENPDLFAYWDPGTAIHSSAIGAPISVYSPEHHVGIELAALQE